MLAKELDAQITAVDFLAAFLDELQSRARDQGVADKITTLNYSMDGLPFALGEYALIDVASAKIGILERHGYSPEAYFVLPTHCWILN